VVDLNQRITEELARLAAKVGKEGKLKQRAEMSDARGFWRDQIHRERADRRPRSTRPPRPRA
jgi:hypothetical protein